MFWLEDIAVLLAILAVNIWYLTILLGVCVRTDVYDVHDGGDVSARFYSWFSS